MDLEHRAPSEGSADSCGVAVTVKALCGRRAAARGGVRHPHAWGALPSGVEQPYWSGNGRRSPGRSEGRGQRLTAPGVTKRGRQGESRAFPTGVTVIRIMMLAEADLVAAVHAAAEGREGWGPGAEVLRHAD
jgi:hypothetical protein